MAGDYIRREDALFALRKAERGGSMTALTRLERAYAEIREMPAADVAPVVHGWWKKVRKSRSTWECSVCGTKVGAFFAGCSQYCYCCGAQMGGVTE